MLKLILFLSLIAGNSSYETATLDRQQAFCLATAVYHESRGEDITGQSAVAHVVLNRVSDSSYPTDICSVIYQPSQFTDIMKASPDYDSNAWENALEAAIFAMLDITEDPTGGALYYYAQNKITPAWHEAYAVQAVIGGHTFLK